MTVASDEENCSIGNNETHENRTEKGCSCMREISLHLIITIMAGTLNFFSLFSFVYYMSTIYLAEIK